MDDDRPYLIEHPAGLVAELPVHWSLDDWEQYAFLPEPDIGQFIEAPSKVLELWTGELDAMRGTRSLAAPRPPGAGRGHGPTSTANQPDALDAAISTARPERPPASANPTS